MILFRFISYKNKNVGNNNKAVRYAHYKSSSVHKGVIPMRAMWKGNISFGLVNIPVSLYKATEEQRTTFRTLHQACQTPIQYKKWCPHCEQEVETQETVRGYEYTPDHYVLITQEDLNNLPLPTLRTIEILHFTEKENVEPIYYENAYYLGPREYGEKPYKLLYEAMKQTNKIAVAKVAFRNKEHLAILRLYQNGLLMNRIHYPSEIRAIEEVPGISKMSQAQISDGELEMAQKLITEISKEFRDDYQSDYEEALQSLIQQKIDKQEVAQPQFKPEDDKVVDLMEALQQSLNQSTQTDPKKKAE